MSTKKENFIYNNFGLYKNNEPLDLDVDIICDELYAIGDDKDKFREYMSKIEKDVLDADLEKKEPVYARSYNYSNNNTHDKSKNKFGFKNTVPEGELLQYPVYQEKVIHKKYADVNANSKYYFPNDVNRSIEPNKSTWTNRANQILMNSQSNGFGFNNTQSFQGKYTPPNLYSTFSPSNRNNFGFN